MSGDDRMIAEPNRQELFNMTTTQLYKLDAKLTKLQEKIKSELICRGDY
jgi:hypothetical protein